MPDHQLESGDSPDLEALFDSMRQQATVEETPPSPPSAAPEPAAAAAEPSAAAQPATERPHDDMYAQIGQMARKLHDALRELGYDKALERVADAIPDAKDRLSYIASLTENAADRVLNATDIAKPIQDQMEEKATELAGQWDRLYSNQLSLDEFKALASSTRQYLQSVPKHTQDTNDQLMEIVMAQDFQDLTGQVIKKVTEMVKILENELVTFLIEFSPPEKKADLQPSLLNGPVVNAEGRTDVVTSQQQVDDLLESLGF